MKANSLMSFARQQGAALVGIAPVERFSGAPQGHKPEDFLPGARTVIAMVMKIPDTIIRNIPSPYYERFGYHDLNAHLRKLAYHVSIFLEDQGYDAFPLDPSVDERVRKVEVLQEEPVPQVRIMGDFSHRHALVASGLGEISAASMAVVPRMGPRIRLVSVITSAPLEPTPEREGKSRFNICQPDQCGLRCSQKCPGKALPGDGTVDHFKCRRYRNPALYTLEYFQNVAQAKRAGKSLPMPKAKDDGGSLTCGICIKVCPIGIDF